MRLSHIISASFIFSCLKMIHSSCQEDLNSMKEDTHQYILMNKACHSFGNDGLPQYAQCFQSIEALEHTTNQYKIDTLLYHMTNVYNFIKVSNRKNEKGLLRQGKLNDENVCMKEAFDIMADYSERLAEKTKDFPLYNEAFILPLIQFNQEYQKGKFFEKIHQEMEAEACFFRAKKIYKTENLHGNLEKMFRVKINEDLQKAPIKFYVVSDHQDTTLHPLHTPGQVSILIYSRQDKYTIERILFSTSFLRWSVEAKDFNHSKQLQKLMEIMNEKLRLLQRQHTTLSDATVSNILRDQEDASDIIKETVIQEASQHMMTYQHSLINFANRFLKEKPTEKNSSNNVKFMMYIFALIVFVSVAFKSATQFNNMHNMLSDFWKKNMNNKENISQERTSDNNMEKIA